MPLYANLYPFHYLLQINSCMEEREHNEELKQKTEGPTLLRTRTVQLRDR